MIVTDASSGIGRATALEVGRAVGTVLLVARTTKGLEDTAREIEAARGLAEVCRADLSAERSIDESESASALQRAVAQLPGGAYW